MSAQRQRQQKQLDQKQFDLFAVREALTVVTDRVTAPAIVMDPVQTSVQCARESDSVRLGRDGSGPAQRSGLEQNKALNPRVRKNGPRLSDIRIVTERDVPAYSDSERAMVDESLKVLPAEKAWFTYADVRAAFTISRATVVRRLRTGLVPGVRFMGSRMLEDGAIRRLTREQVRYLLLAMRRS